MLAFDRPATFDKMPVDFQSYLLQSSPPAYNKSSLMNYCTNYRPVYTKRVADINRSPVVSRKHPPGFKLKSIILDKDCGLKSPGSDGEQCDGLSSPDSPLSPEIGQCQFKTKKRVSFADTNGLALVQVRIMSEPSDMPPVIPPGILSALTDGACAGAVSHPPLTLDFKQPASDYMKFREKIEKNFVSLENVIVRDYSLLGTVKVKNVAFDKKVILRVTFDSWETTLDIGTKYVPCGSDQVNPFDTFSFEIKVPPNADPQKSVEFAVNYEVCGRQYWDNNDGCNYKVVSSFFKKTDSSNFKPYSLLEIDQTHSWSEFSSWSRLDTSSPYW